MTIGYAWSRKGSEVCDCTKPFTGETCQYHYNEIADKADKITNYFLQNCSATVSKKDYDEVVRILNL